MNRTRRLLTGVVALTTMLTMARGGVGAARAQINAGTSFEHAEEDGMWGYHKEVKVVVAQRSPLILYVVYNVGSRGLILKVSGSGEDDGDMLNLSYKNGDVEIKPPIVGSQKFSERISDVQVISGSTLVSFGEGKMLKIAGTGGTGHNMFAVMPAGGGMFKSVPGYKYYQGDMYFGSRVVLVRAAGPSTFIGLADGSLLKVKGTGTTGHNIFALSRDAHGWKRWKLDAATSYEGDQRLGARVTAILSIFIGGKASQTLLAFDDGRILKVSGTGGTGHNMFNVTADNSGFHTTDTRYKAHRLGDSYTRAAYDGVVSYATSMIRFADGADTIIGFSDGRMMRVKGTGGTGYNMFNVVADKWGFSTWSNKWAARLVGTQYFPGHRINGIASVSGGVAVAIEDFDDSDTSGPQQHTHQLAFFKTVGTGHNMLAVKEKGLLGGKPCDRAGGIASSNCSGIYTDMDGYSNLRQPPLPSSKATPVDVLAVDGMLFFGFNINVDDSKNNLILTKRLAKDLTGLGGQLIPDPNW